MKFFFSSAHNEPAGGTKVLNQMVKLCQEKGFKAYLVIPKVYQAQFLDDATTEVIDFATMIELCQKEDVVIDCWQSKESWEAIQKVSAATRVFWQHGASIPQGGNTVGDVAYRTGSPYTHFWNVSKACAEYLAQKYKLKKIDIVHPFFDTEVMREYQKLKTTYQRNGLLILARRGQKYLPTIIKKFCPRNKITVMHGYFHEREFFEELLRHRFFISIDDGIDAPVWYKQIIRSIKKMFDPALREKELHRNIWLVPSGHLLGFPVSAAEAATLGTAVIGFAMGGGLEWMNTETCFLAQDRDQNSLLSAIEKAINTPSGEVDRVVKNAEGAVGVFTKEHTWTQMKESLRFSV